MKKYEVRLVFEYKYGSREENGCQEDFNDECVSYPMDYVINEIGSLEKVKEMDKESLHSAIVGKSEITPHVMFYGVYYRDDDNLLKHSFDIDGSIENLIELVDFYTGLRTSWVDSKNN